MLANRRDIYREVRLTRVSEWKVGHDSREGDVGSPFGIDWVGLQHDRIVSLGQFCEVKCLEHIKVTGRHYGVFSGIKLEKLARWYNTIEASVPHSRKT